MEYYTIKSNMLNTRINGKYASYPVFERATGNQVYIHECYSDDVDDNMKRLNSGDNIGFFKYEN